MALTFAAAADPTVTGNKRVTFTDITFDNSYPTGGEAVTAANLGLQRVDFALCQIKSVSGGLVNVVAANYDLTNAKILLFDETPAQVANAADMSTTVVRVLAYGS